MPIYVEYAASHYQSHFWKSMTFMQIYVFLNNRIETLLGDNSSLVSCFCISYKQRQRLISS